MQLTEGGALRAEVAPAPDVVGIGADPSDAPALHVHREPAHRLAERARANVNSVDRERHLAGADSIRAPGCGSAKGRRSRPAPPGGPAQPPCGSAPIGREHRPGGRAGRGWTGAASGSSEMGDPMKARTTLLAFGLGITTLALWAAPSLGMKGGTDILHMTLRTGLAPTGADPDAAGMLVGMLRQQGKADIQKLRLAVSHLAPDSTYLLFVRRRGALTPTEVLTFDTAANGEATLNLMHHGNGKGGKTFPLGLDPLSDVVGIEIHDDADVDVLDADLTTPDGFQYLVKRRLTPDLNVDQDSA